MITGFTCGAFDLLHPGHVYFLGVCKKHCDQLIVGLHTDPTLDRHTKNKPIQSVFERWYQLKAHLGPNDLIIPYDTELDLLNMLGMLPINKRFLGTDYMQFEDAITGFDRCKLRNIELVYIQRDHTYSSSELRNRLKQS
jgi:glycerol-3-phosphate cytidylyltransferase